MEANEQGDYSSAVGRDSDESPPQTVDVLLFRPDRLFVDPENPAKGYNRWIGEAITPTWEQVVAALSRSDVGDPVRFPDPNDAKRMRGAWVGGLYLWGHRLQQNFIRSQVMGFDIDSNGEVSRALDAFGPFRKVCHSTYKHRASNARCRVVIPLSEPCLSLEEFRRVHRAIRANLVGRGVYGPDDIDPAGSDASRAWWFPMHYPGVEPVFAQTGGAELDLARVLASLPPEPPRPVVAHTPTANGFGAVMYAVRQMAATPPGARHNRLIALCRWLRDCGLTPSEVIPVLAPAVSSGERHERQVERQIVSGMQGGSR